MKKCITDLAVGCIFLAVSGIAWCYPEQIRYQESILWIAIIAAIVCFFLAFLDKKGEKKRPEEFSEASGTEADTQEW